MCLRFNGSGAYSVFRGNYELWVDFFRVSRDLVCVVPVYLRGRLFEGGSNTKMF